MRKSSAVLATLSLAVLALTGCTAAPTYDGAACDRDAGDTGLRDAVSVEGDIGGSTDVEIFAPVHVSSSVFADTVVGDGRALVDGSQGLVGQIAVYSGETGDQVFELPYDEATTPAQSIDYWAERVPGLGDALPCATAGSRVVAALTPEDFGPQNIAGFGMEDDDVAVVVFDVVDVLLPRAEGSLRFNDASGMPTVVRAPDGTPGVIIPKIDAPESQVVQTLIEGEGEPLTADQTPLVNFTAVGWADRQVIRTTWGDAPTSQFSQMAPPVAEALVGQKIGSQVLIVVPDTENSPAMAFVIDILGTVAAPTP
ncbi:hypothetical protein [Microbacterium sp. 179-I 3D4 NHS]|uniref:hypothetical protein n=1 Tax=Microbacterium sp. 179-I 3D4 NHS TaxID=3142381 RepID=UPI0039A2663F